jgi:hypothetical protein
MQARNHAIWGWWWEFDVNARIVCRRNDDPGKQGKGLKAFRLLCIATT